jgi:hypothetical protein
VLLKADTVEKNDVENVGVLMILLLVTVIVSVFGTVVLEARAAMHWAHEIKYARATTEKSPAFDPSLQDHIIAIHELTIGKVLGQGAEGTVCKATYAGTEVAVKITSLLAFGRTSAKDMLQEAQLEAQTLQPLHHPVGSSTPAHLRSLCS